MERSIAVFVILFISLKLSAQHTLIVQLTKIKKIKGQLELCLYDDESAYMQTGQAVACVWIDVEDVTINHTFSDLPDGTYAAVVIQDLNGNKDLDTNFMGIPKEPYGFSNNHSTTFGPPSFQKAGFVLTSDQSIEIELE